MKPYFKTFVLLSVGVMAGIFFMSIALSSPAFIQPVSSFECPEQPMGIEVYRDSYPGTITEHFAEADIVVYGVIEKVYPTRAITRTLLPEDSRQRYGWKEDVTPFTDSTLQVLTMYKGAAADRITITQYGGHLTANERHPEINTFTDGNSIFLEESKHVLFLKRIPDDDINAPEYETYRIINPAGRYDVYGEMVCRGRFYSPPRYIPPQTLAELEDRIRNGEPPLPTPWPTSVVQPPTAILASGPYPPPHMDGGDPPVPYPPPPGSTPIPAITVTAELVPAIQR